MNKQYQPRRVASPSAPGLKALLTTTSIAAAIGGWAVIAYREAPADPLPTQQAVEIPLAAPASSFSLPDLPPIAALPTLVPRPANFANLSVAAPPQPQPQQPLQAPTAVQASLPKAPQAPAQSLRSVSPPPVITRKTVPMATTRSSR
jgi:hypothetical protein